MRSLFAKIFISFWIAQALFFVLVVLVTWVIRQQSEAGIEAAHSRIFNEAVNAYEKGGKDGIHQYLDQLRESQHIRAYLMDEHGEDVTGRQVPEWIRKNESQPPGAAPGDFWGTLPRFTVLKQSLTTPEGHHYTMVTIEPPSGPFGPRAMTWRGILIGIISSGLVCYLLAGYLVKPVVRLREAAQKLAAGDLTARAGGGTGRGDEISQLVGDFDTMAERLEKLVNAQARLLNDISHELRSPLARINVALALARQRSGREAEAFLDRMDLESERLNELVGRLLTIARLDSGGEGIQKQEVDLGELIQEIAEDADFEAQGRGSHVIASIRNACVVEGNPSLLHSAIENVVRNAARYTADGSSVEVSLEEDRRGIAPEAIIRVNDSGPGVPEDALEKMFLPFYRIDDARGRQTGGVGLGLAITQRAVKTHGGTVRARNRNRKEGGLTVEIRLPLLRTEDLSQTAPVETLPLASS